MRLLTGGDFRIATQDGVNIPRVSAVKYIQVLIMTHERRNTQCLGDWRPHCRRFWHSTLMPAYAEEAWGRQGIASLGMEAQLVNPWAGSMTASQLAGEVATARQAALSAVTSGRGKVTLTYLKDKSGSGLQVSEVTSYDVVFQGEKFRALVSHSESVMIPIEQVSFRRKRS